MCHLSFFKQDDCYQLRRFFGLHLLKQNWPQNSILHWYQDLIRSDILASWFFLSWKADGYKMMLSKYCYVKLRKLLYFQNVIKYYIMIKTKRLDRSVGGQVFFTYHIPGLENMCSSIQCLYTVSNSQSLKFESKLINIILLIIFITEN